MKRLYASHYKQVISIVDCKLRPSAIFWRSAGKVKVSYDWGLGLGFWLGRGPMHMMHPMRAMLNYAGEAGKLGEAGNDYTAPFVAAADNK